MRAPPIQRQTGIFLLILMIEIILFSCKRNEDHFAEIIKKDITVTADDNNNVQEIHEIRVEMIGGY